MIAGQIIKAGFDVVYFDMDGVLADFANAVGYGLFGREFGSMNPHGRSTVEELGVTHDGFWRVLNAADQDFWANIPPLLDGVFLWHHIRRSGVVCRVCTSPSRQPSCLAGKHTWIQRHLRLDDESYFDGFHMTSKKYELARPGRLLIDDTEKHVTAFRSSGGCSILWRGSGCCYDLSGGGDGG